MAYTAPIIGFKCRRKECSHPRAENTKNQFCPSLTTWPLTSCETLNKPLNFWESQFFNLENGRMYLGCLFCQRFVC